MRILLDTNILLRSSELGHSHHQVCLDAIEVLRQRNHRLIIAPQMLYEFWVVATRPSENNGLGMSPIEAHAERRAIQQLFSLVLDERGVYAVWEGLVSSLGVKGKQAHDARIAALMRRHAVTHLLTFNGQDFSRYSFATAISPIDVVSGAISV